MRRARDARGQSPQSSRMCTIEGRAERRTTRPPARRRRSARRTQTQRGFAARPATASTMGDGRDSQRFRRHGTAAPAHQVGEGPRGCNRRALIYSWPSPGGSPRGACARVFGHERRPTSRRLRASATSASRTPSAVSTHDVADDVASASSSDSSRQTLRRATRGSASNARFPIAGTGLAIRWPVTSRSARMNADSQQERRLK